ncbi:MAG: hypothetical protein RJB61_2369 [Actinomycetota bacterium]|jgi:hypothetical protein
MASGILRGVLVGAAALSIAGPSAALAMPPDSTLVWDGGTVEFADFDSPVDVTATLEAGDPAQPKVFERTEVTVGDGVELDESDLVSNPGDLAGAVSVDIDEEAETITVTVTEEGCVTGLSVRIAYDGSTAFISEQVAGLFGDATDVELAAEGGLGAYVITWAATGDTCVELGPVGSASSFNYALYLLAYDDFGPDDPMPVAGNGTSVALTAAALLMIGAVLTRLAVRRVARPR